MKFKKLFITLPVATMSAGLLATVLTSCSSSNIDDDKKVTLDDEGKLNKGIDGKITSYTYKDAVKWALTRSTSWATFKEALAEEIVLQWYEDRMYEDKDGKKERNKTFKSNYDEWKYQIDKDYDNLVQSQKTKYGSNYKFYLQNEYLSQYGGTEETYKHAKLVEKVKSEFTTNVFKFNYFGYSSAVQKAGSEVIKAYPQIFVNDASTTVSRENLNNPENWSKIGFFASVNPSFSMKTWPETLANIDVDFLAKNPDGDYATIQNFVFDKYYDEVKPFMSAASLFKYSKPHGIEEGDKLSVIYNTADTAVKLPDEPNESFPFFGGAEPTDATKGTRMYMEWFEAFNNGDFATKYNEGANLSNGTISISNTASGGKGKYSEDSQTLLLASAVQMLGGTDSLYVPYATVAAQMYQNMMLGTPTSTSDERYNASMNYITKEYMAKVMPADVFEAVKNNNPAILKNFFFDPTQYNLFANTYKGALNSYLDLSRVYPDGIVDPSKDGSTKDKAIEYHCPLFKNVKNFTYLYGDTSATGDAIEGPNKKWYTPNSGVVFVTNTMYLENFVPEAEAVKGKINGQPWALQLNQSGMHAQTIDGYDFVVNHSDYLKTAGTDVKSRSEAAKLVFKYRLMQKRTDQIDFMSGDLLGSSGKLKTYFTNNFADIILEMAQNEDTKNMFRKLDTFKKASVETATDYFFKKTAEDQKFNLTNLTAYLDAVSKYDKAKKNIESVEKINSYIYEYRTKVITTAKSTSTLKTIYGNGLLAPLTYAYLTLSKVSSGITNHDYRECNVVADIVFHEDEDPSIATRTYRSSLTALAKAVSDCEFVKTDSQAAKVNEDTAFSPQIKSAKDVMSNRFWYKSAIIDKVMYAASSNKTGITNAIKSETYQAYEKNISENDATLGGYDNWINTILPSPQLQNAITSTYRKGKVITGNTTYAELGNSGDTYDDFIKKLTSRYTLNLEYQRALNGDYADDILNQTLFQATLAYLSANNYQNLYKALNSKIGENEVALVGYINKLNPWFPGTEQVTPSTAVTKDSLAKRYGFNANVDNLFDQDGFAGGSIDPTSAHSHSKDASSTYWNLINSSTYSGALAGFTGIQSKTSNSFDSASGMQTAVFDKFAWSTQRTTNILADSPTPYEQNEGAWFAFAGSYQNNGTDLITFNDIVYKPESGTTRTFVAKQLQGDDTHTKCRPILRLAKKIADYDSIDDLKTLAKSIADAYDGGTLFKLIGYGEKTYQDADEMRIDMLEELPHYTITDGQLSAEPVDTKGYLKCFNRIQNVEVHTTTKLDVGSQDYCFDDGKGNGYNAFIKQLNKADITEKRLHYTFKSGAWTTESSDNPLTAEEFLFILCSTAADTSTQSAVITQAIKQILGDDKLTIYDAGLYNTFDSSWIKDWVKKPLGK